MKLAGVHIKRQGCQQSGVTNHKLAVRRRHVPNSRDKTPPETIRQSELEEGRTHPRPTSTSLTTSVVEECATATVVAHRSRYPNMKTLRIQLLTLSAATSLFASLAVADETAYAKILKERDAVLSKILSDREARLATGGISEEAVPEARLALYVFRRDTAPTKAEKLKQQDLIVAVYEKKLAMLNSRAAAGIIGPEELLLARDSLLQAQQLREEFQLAGKNG
jgi:hypothetical protein